MKKLKRQVNEDILSAENSELFTWGYIKNLLEDSGIILEDEDIIDIDCTYVHELREDIYTLTITRTREETDEEYGKRKEEFERINKLQEQFKEKSDRLLYEELKKKYER